MYLLFYLQVFDLYGVGSRQAFSTPSLAKELDLKVTSLAQSFHRSMGTLE